MPTAYIALGANLPSPAGSPCETLAAAVARLRKLGEVLAVSSFYVTRPVGLAGQPDFLNAAAALRTNLTPQSLLDHLLEMERIFGRNRLNHVLNGPRTLDLDLLFFGDYSFSTQKLQLPHPRLADRAFVLIPLQEIAPQLIHPILRKTVSELLQDLKPDSEDFPDVTPSPSPVHLGCSSVRSAYSELDSAGCGNRDADPA